MIANSVHSPESRLNEDYPQGDLPPIPTPPSQYWREFRIQVLPIIVFCLVVAACVVLWRHVGAGGQLVGLAEGPRSIVASPVLGLIQELKVKPYQWVEEGQPLATIMPMDPRSKLDLLQSELQIASLRMEPSLEDQNAMNFEQVRFDLLRLKQELAVAKINLQRAENALKRNEVLFKEKLVSEDMYDFSLKDRDMIQAEIEEKTKSIAQIEERMSALKSVGEPQAPGTNNRMMETMARLQEKMDGVQTNWGNVILRAPMSGMVHLVYRQSGEYTAEGEPLITISSERSDCIVAYMRQPYAIEPERGWRVEVTTRARKRQNFTTEITTVGAQVEIITNALAFIKTGALVDVGLPIVVRVPSDIHIRPGEMVDLIVVPPVDRREEQEKSPALTRKR